jgi:hypothetical protein
MKCVKERACQVEKVLNSMKSEILFIAVAMRAKWYLVDALAVVTYA